MFSPDLFFQIFPQNLVQSRIMKVLKIWFVKLSLWKCLIFGKRIQKQSNVLPLFIMLLLYWSLVDLISPLWFSTLLSSGVAQIQRSEIVTPLSSKHIIIISSYTISLLFKYLFTCLSLHFYHITFSFPLPPISNHSMYIMYAFLLRYL